MHGEQHGAIDQEVTLDRSDFAPVSLLTEDRADVLEFRINGKHCDHSFHLHPRHTATDAWPGQGLWSSLWGRPYYPMKMSPSPSFASGLVVPWANGTSMPRGRRERTNGLGYQRPA